MNLYWLKSMKIVDHKNNAFIAKIQYSLRFKKVYVLEKNCF